MRRKAKAIALGSGLAALAVLAGVRLEAPSWARKEILSHLRETCPSCRIEIGEIELGLIQGRLIARSVVVTGDPKDKTRFRARAEAVRFDVRPWTLIRGTPWIRTLRVDGLAFTLSENGDAPPGPPSDYPWIRHLPAAHVEVTEVRGSQFTYELEKKGKAAFLTFHDVSGDAGPVGTRRELSPAFAGFKLSARQGESGKVSIQAHLGLFEEEKNDRIEISARDEKLEDLNTFFVPSEGMRLQGRLVEGHASLDVRQRVLKCRMSVVYEGLKVDFLSGHPEQSPVGAFFKSAAAKAVVKKSQPAPQGGELPPEVEVTVTQKPQDGVFDFLLDGLKEAVEKIVKG